MIYMPETPIAFGGLRNLVNPYPMPCTYIQLMLQQRSVPLPSPKVGSLAPLICQDAAPFLKNVSRKFPRELAQIVVAPDGQLPPVLCLVDKGAYLCQEGVGRLEFSLDQAVAEGRRRNQVDVRVMGRPQLEKSRLKRGGQ